MKLNYPTPLAESEIVGRILGPDIHGAYCVAVGAEYFPEWDEQTGLTVREARTVVTVRPVGPAELKQGLWEDDAWGQPWLLSVRDGGS